MIYCKYKLYLFAVFALVGMFLFLPSTVKAGVNDPWPGNQYDNSSQQSNLRILLSRTFQHPSSEGGKVVFAIYSDTKYEGANRARVTINPVGSCDLADSRRVEVWGEGQRY
jgi:hypothetical protein